MSPFYYTKPSPSPLHASYVSAQFKVIIKKNTIFKSNNSLFVTFIDNKLEQLQIATKKLCTPLMQIFTTISVKNSPPADAAGSQAGASRSRLPRVQVHRTMCRSRG